jgi:hypothetical protein
MPRPYDALLAQTTLSFCDRGLIKPSSLKLESLA